MILLCGLKILEPENFRIANPEERTEYIIADEPTANLDSKSTEELLTLMKKMNEKFETTFVFATHDQRVMDKARRIVTIDDGKVMSDENFER